MTGYPSPLFALLQGLLTAAILITPLLIMAFATGLRTTMTDVALALLTYPVLALGTIFLFTPFEGVWVDAAFGSLIALRSMLVGGIALALGMIFAQRKGMARRSLLETVPQVGAAFLMGAVWGAAWGFSGWCLQQFGMTSYG